MTNQELAKRIRIHALKMCHKAKASHIGSCLSCADILAVLYNEILQENDRLIISKGHCAAAVYAVLAETGKIPMEWLDRYYQDGAELHGLVEHNAPGVVASTGSLGHGLSIACGMAMAKQGRVFTLLSDGEMDEGSIWEAILFAGHHKLGNLIAIVDYNKLQACGKTDEVLYLGNLAAKWRAFNWDVYEVIDGNDVEQLKRSIGVIPDNAYLPSCVIAHTVKGKGVSSMENKAVWHYKYPNDEELRLALKEIMI